MATDPTTRPVGATVTLPVDTGATSGSSHVRATAVSSYLTSSARNRYQGQTTSMSLVPIQNATPVVIASDPRPALPSTPAVIVSEPTADQQTNVPENQHTIHEITPTPPESDPRQPSVSLASSSTIPSLAQMQPSIPTVSVDTTEDNELVFSPRERGKSSASWSVILFDNFPLARHTDAHQTWFISKLLSCYRSKRCIIKHTHSSV